MNRTLVIVLLCFASSAFGQTESGTGIVYGTDHAFSITAPEGWVLDNSAGKGSGLQAVFYRVGDSWADGIAVMYVNTSARDPEVHDTLEGLIAYDVGRFQQTSPNLSVEELAAVELDGGKEAVARKFSGDQHGNIEAVAYVEEETVFVMIILTSRDEQEFEEAYPSFRALVSSYKFITSDVRLPE